MPGGQIGGQGHPIKRIIWVFVACCIVAAILNGFPDNPKGFYRGLQHKSDQLKSVAHETVKWLGLTTNGSLPQKIAHATGTEHPASRSHPAASTHRPAAKHH